MPLFFLLSGYLYCCDKYTYSELVILKVKRLLIPFVSIALLFFIIKAVVAQIVAIDHPVTLASTIGLFVTPQKSFMPLLWFIHSLFLIFLIYPVAWRYLNNAQILAIAILANLLLLQAGEGVVLIGTALYYLPFFAVGVVLREKEELWRRIACPSWADIRLAAICFLCWVSFASLCDVDIRRNYLFRFVGGSDRIMDGHIHKCIYG